MIRQILGWFLIGAAAVFCAANRAAIEAGSRQG
jgi:hypothetical protein